MSKIKLSRTKNDPSLCLDMLNASLFHESNSIIGIFTLNISYVSSKVTWTFLLFVWCPCLLFNVLTGSNLDTVFGTVKANYANCLHVVLSRQSLLKTQEAPALSIRTNNFK